MYRRYAGLFFCFCVDVNDNGLVYMEAIHNFVEVLSFPFLSFVLRFVNYPFAFGFVGPCVVLL